MVNLSKLKKERQEHIQASTQKYPLAYDYNYPRNNVVEYGKGWFAVETNTDLREIYTQIREQTKKNRCYYEIINNDTPKFYMDFDKFEITRDEFETYLMTLTDKINLILNTNFMNCDLNIYTREEDDDLVRSVHIVFHFRMAKKEQKLICEYLKGELSHIDTKIYTKNRQFCLPFNTKLKYNGTRHFLPFQTQDDSEKYLVNYVDEFEVKTIPQRHKLTLVLSKFRNFKLKDAFNRLKKNRDKYREELFVLDALDLMKIVLPLKFYKSNDWVILVKLLKKYKYKYIDDFLRNSCKNTKYNYEDNLAFYNSITDVKYGKEKLKEIFEKYTKLRICFSNINEKFLWICKKLNTTDLAYIKDLLNDDESSFFHDNSTITFSGKTGVLKRDDIVIGNYFFEVEYLRVNPLEEDGIHIDNLSLIEPYLDNWFLHGGIISVKAKWGSGKTHHVILNIIKRKQRIIILTENNALNTQLYEKFKEYGFKSHQKELGGIDLQDTTSPLVCSLESISQIIFQKNDILIMDEFESLLHHYESDTYKLITAQQSFNKLILGLRLCSRVILLDADISKERTDLVKKITNKKITKIISHDDNFKGYVFTLYISQNFMNSKIKELLDDGKKIVYCSNSKNSVQSVYDTYSHRINSMIVVSEKVEITIDGIVAILPKTELKNIEDLIISNKICLFCYSPTIKTGVSINSEYFDEMFAYGTYLTCCVREFIQMLFRARKLKNKRINVSVSNAYFKTKQYIHIDICRETIVKRNGNVISYQVLKCEIITDQTSQPLDPFDDLNAINLWEQENSKKLFCQDLIYRMKYNHNIDFVIDESETEEVESLIKEFDWTMIRLVFPSEYSERKDELSSYEIEKHCVFFRWFFIEDISDKEEETTTYHRFNNNHSIGWLLKKAKISYFLRDVACKTHMDFCKENASIITEIKQKKSKLTKFDIMITKQSLFLHVFNLFDKTTKNIPFTITNNQLDFLIKQKDIINYINTQLKLYQIENHHVIKDKKTLISGLIDIFKDFGVSIKYINKNNTKPTDKLIIYFVKSPCGFKNEKRYLSRFSEPIFRTEKQSKGLYKQKNYYTNYKIKRPKLFIKKYDDVIDTNSWFQRYNDNTFLNIERDMMFVFFELISVKPTALSREDIALRTNNYFEKVVVNKNNRTCNCVCDIFDEDHCILCGGIEKVKVEKIIKEKVFFKPHVKNTNVKEVENTIIEVFE